jgi:hypothetical protein
MDGYRDVQYFMAPIAGLPDSALIQRFVYPLRWDRLTVDIDYRNRVVFDVDVSGGRDFGRRAMPKADAYSRLQWKPSGQ